MFTDWIHWLWYPHQDELLALLWGLLLVDGPRYALTKVLICAWDWARSLVAEEKVAETGYTHCPTVCVVMPAHNEASTIEAALQSVWGTYPRLEIIAIDDGSRDETGAVARRFARSHPGVLVLRMPRQSGKSPAMNAALPYTRAEVIVNMDADSHLAPNAIWEVVQPLADPQVGAVSANQHVRNAFDNVLTWLQAYEYLQMLGVERIFLARVGMLGICPGAFSAYRRAALETGGGWDVGPIEDIDLTLRVRKAGWQIAYTPYAECFTDVPRTWHALVQQRLRWTRGTIIRSHCRKHIDMVYPGSAHFTWCNVGVVVGNWFLHLFIPVAIMIWLATMCLFATAEQWARILVSLYVCYVASEVVQFSTQLYYSLMPGRLLRTALVIPLIPFYRAFLFMVQRWGTIEEIFWRKSFEEKRIPVWVGQTTWRW